jgi:hypothetical protein
MHFSWLLLVRRRNKIDEILYYKVVSIANLCEHECGEGGEVGLYLYTLICYSNAHKSRDLDRDQQGKYIIYQLPYGMEPLL